MKISKSFFKSSLALILFLTSCNHGFSEVTATSKDQTSNKPNSNNIKAPLQENISSQRTETTNYENWVLTCRDTPDGKAKKTCNGVFQLIEKERRAVLLTWIIGKTSDGNLMTFIQVPTGVLIQNGIELKFGGQSTPRKLNYVACEPSRCEASTAMDDSFIRDLNSNQKATATIISTDGRIAKFELNINGIDKILPSLTQQ